MTGLLFLGFLALWFFVARWFARKLTSRLPPGKLRIAAVWILVVIFIALPLADEIIGGFQLRSLCANNAVLKVDAEKIKGKRVRVVADPVNKDVDSSPIRIYYSRESYRDVETNEELASYTWYVAKGGWLMRTLAMTNGISPLTIHPSSCSDEKMLAKYEFTLVK